MLRFLRYLSYIFVARKMIQGARSAIGPDGFISNILSAGQRSIQNQIKKFIFGTIGSTLLFVGSLYILFHTAIEWDTLGYLTFNAQKGVCLTLIGVGIVFIYPSRKALRKPKTKPLPATLTADPTSFTSQVNHERALQIHNFFEMINQETAKFIEMSTRPQNSQRTRPPIPEHDSV